MEFDNVAIQAFLIRIDKVFGQSAKNKELVNQITNVCNNVARVQLSDPEMYRKMMFGDFDEDETVISDWASQKKEFYNWQHYNSTSYFKVLHKYLIEGRFASTEDIIANLDEVLQLEKEFAGYQTNYLNELIKFFNQQKKEFPRIIAGVYAWLIKHSEEIQVCSLMSNIDSAQWEKSNAEIQKIQANKLAIRNHWAVI